MKHLAFALVLLLAAFGAADARKPILVSGYDDVLRQADNTGLVRAARRLMSADVSYAGMPALYQLLSSPGSEPPFFVVSATSSALAPRARAFLARAGYPAPELYFRSWTRQWSAERFRLVQIERILSSRVDRRFIFVFDNSPTSVAVTRKLLQAHASRLAAIYLRETVSQDVPPGATSFVTAFDIAVNEFSAGRMTAIDTARVAAAILREQDAANVIPAYSYCPGSLPPCPVRDPEVLSLCDSVRERVQAICAARRRETSVPPF